MRFYRTSALLLTFACSAIACGRPPVVQTTVVPSSPDSAAVRPVIEAAMQRFNHFMRAGPADSVAAMFTQDGELYEPREAVHKGRTSIRSFFAPLTVDVRIESATTTTQALEVRAGSVMQWGEYVENGGPVSQATRAYRGRFVAEWVRQSNGRWLLHRLMLQPLTNR